VRQALLSADAWTIHGTAARRLPMSVSLVKPTSSSAPPTPAVAPDDRLASVDRTLLDLVQWLARTEARRFLRSSRGVTDRRTLWLMVILGLGGLLLAALWTLHAPG